MGSISNRKLSTGQYEVLYVEYTEPEWKLTVFSEARSSRAYKIGTGSIPGTVTTLGPFADPLPVALTGTVTLTNGSASIVGVATLFTTELVEGDVVMLADGKILGRIVTTPTGDLAADLDANWEGATAGPGVTLYKATMIERTLPNGGSASFILPRDISGTTILTRKYLYIEAVNAPIIYDLVVQGVDVHSVRDSLAIETV